MSLFRSPSGASPIDRACNTTTYYTAPGGFFPSVKSILNNPSVHDDLLPNRVRTVFCIAFLYCCRISELLDCTIGDHISPDRLVCKGKKGSNSYIIYLPGLSKFVSNLANPSVNYRIFPFSYGYLYRWAVKIGIPVRLNGRNNSAVLHLSRYVFSHKCSNRLLPSVIGDCLRHRARESVSYYLNKGVSSNG